MRAYMAASSAGVTLGPVSRRPWTGGFTLMDYFTTTSNAARRTSACIIVGVYENGKLGAGAADVDAASGGLIRAQLKQGDLSRILLPVSAPGRCCL